MTNLERRVAEAYEQARNSPIVVKAKRNMVHHSTTFTVTDEQMAQMSLIGGKATNFKALAREVERAFLLGEKR